MRFIHILASIIATWHHAIEVSIGTWEVRKFQTMHWFDYVQFPITDRLWDFLIKYGLKDNWICIGCMY